MRFEYTYVTWADLTDLTLAAPWDVWARQQEWSWLPGYHLRSSVASAAWIRIFTCPALILALGWSRCHLKRLSIHTLRRPNQDGPCI